MKIPILRERDESGGYSSKGTYIVTVRCSYCMVKSEVTIEKYTPVTSESVECPNCGQSGSLCLDKE